MSELIELLRKDLARFEQTFRLRNQPYSRKKVFLESFLFKAGFQAVFLYRLSHYFFLRNKIYLAWFLTRLNVFFTGAEIEFNAKIGPGLFIAHPVGIVIGRGTTLGSNVTLFQGVTFGARSWHAKSIDKFPSVGNDCFFFANSTIVGGISIGNKCIVASNSLLVEDLLDGSLACGVPAVIHFQEGKEKILSWGLP